MNPAKKDHLNKVFSLAEERIIKLRKGDITNFIQNKVYLNEAYERSINNTKEGYKSLADCTTLSLVRAMIMAEMDGLSLSPTHDEVSLFPDGKGDVVECKYFRTGLGWGRYLMNMRAIIGYTPVQMVYEGDDVQRSVVNGVMQMSHTPKGNTDLKKATGGYLYVTLVNGYVMSFFYEKSDWTSWKKPGLNSKPYEPASVAQLKSKMLRHALMKVPFAKAKITLDDSETAYYEEVTELNTETPTLKIETQPETDLPL